jgi:hypothetical protein
MASIFCACASCSCNSSRSSSNRRRSAISQAMSAKNEMVLTSFGGVARILVAHAQDGDDLVLAEDRHDDLTNHGYVAVGGPFRFGSLSSLWMMGTRLRTQSAQMPSWSTP